MRRRVRAGFSPPPVWKQTNLGILCLLAQTEPYKAPKHRSGPLFRLDARLRSPRPPDGVLLNLAEPVLALHRGKPSLRVLRLFQARR